MDSSIDHIYISDQAWREEDPVVFTRHHAARLGLPLSMPGNGDAEWLHLMIGIMRDKRGPHDFYLLQPDAARGTLAAKCVNAETRSAEPA